MTMCELRQKEVINVADGCRFGFVNDIEFDCEDGELEAIIVPGPAKLLGVFGREQEYCIPWCAVKQIGDDVILVDVETKKVMRDCG